MKVEITALSHTFFTPQPRPALLDLNLNIPSGHFTAIIGPSGCGKSTLLRLIAGLLRPTGGRILLDGQTPAQANAARQVAWLAQSPALLPWLTVEGNIALARKLLAARLNHQMSVQEALRRVGLEDAAQAYPFTLSGGMQQRLALARLLIQNAGLWLMDEPFAALDEITREQLAEMLLDLWEPRRPTVLWVTHNIYEALRLAGRIIVLSAAPGHIVADFSVDLPHPRREDAPAFQELLREVRAALNLAVEAAA
ncbi:MAG: heme ABC exporter ATP-binding protein CcmA [Chloroflexota bacterium]